MQAGRDGATVVQRRPGPARRCNVISRARRARLYPPDPRASAFPLPSVAARAGLAL